MATAVVTSFPSPAPVVSGIHQPVAELQPVSKRFAAQTALSDLSLALQPGEIVALLGPNGAGKSTAVRCLLGLTPPTSGTARIFGQDPRDPATRTRIGAMLQVGAAPEMLTPREHLQLFRSYYPNPMPLAELSRPPLRHALGRPETAYPVCPCARRRPRRAFPGRAHGRHGY